MAHISDATCTTCTRICDRCYMNLSPDPECKDCGGSGRISYTEPVLPDQLRSAIHLLIEAKKFVSRDYSVRAQDLSIEISEFIGQCVRGNQR